MGRLVDKCVGKVVDAVEEYTSLWLTSIKGYVEALRGEAGGACGPG